MMAKGLDVKLKHCTGMAYSEVYGGTGGVLYHLLNPETLEAYHFPTFCKDFFTDAFWSENMKKPSSIWGFSWKPGTLPAHARRYEMGLTFPGETDFGKTKSSTIELFLNAWEKRMKLPVSVVRPDMSGSIAVVQFDAKWPVRPVMVSLLTLLMRLGPGYDGGSVPEYLEKIVKKGNHYGKFDKNEMSKAGVLPLLISTFETGKHPHPDQSFEQYGNPHGCHHSGGIIAYTTGVATG